MNASRHREIASAIIIDTFGRFLLQQRDNILGILQPGKVGLFGGHCEGDETYLECIVREIEEELTYPVNAELFEHLLRLDGPDIDVEGGTARGDFFIVRDIPVDPLVITEGTLLIVKTDEIAKLESKLMPSARLAMKVFFDRGF